MANHTLTEVDPRTLVVIDQVRHDATPDDALVASVREHGIIEAPVVARTPDGELVIITGHRRVGAAIAAGIDIITVLERDVADEGERLAVQIVENERRRQLEVEEVAGGFQKLEELFGLTPDDIAAAVGETPDRVRAGLKVFRSKATTKAIAKHPTIDLERAAIIAEFDGHKALQDELTTVAVERPQNFASHAEHLRGKLAIEEKIHELTLALNAKRVKVVKVTGYMEYTGSGGKGAPLDRLETPEGKKLTATSHKKCPGHVGFITGTYSLSAVKTEYGCSNWEANGHQRAGYKPAEPTPEQLQAEAERTERLALIEANRTARRQWIHDLLPGKINQLSGVYEYMAGALLNFDNYYGADHRAPLITLPLLDVEVTQNERDASGVYSELAASRRVAPFRLMLATALGVHEERCARASRVDAPMIVAHFAHLEKWGYTLSDIDTEARNAAAAALAEADAQAEADASAESSDVDEEDAA